MGSEVHVVMLPWSAFGHLIPFYHLSVALAKQGVRVSYISSPKNIERLPEIPPELASLMQYVSLPLTSVPGLPVGAEATSDVEFDEVQYLKVAYDLLCDPLKEFLLNHSPNWVISDFAAHWLPEITKKLEIKLMYFSIFSACSLAFFGPPEYLTGEGQQRERKTPQSMTTTPRWGAGVFPPSVAFRGYEAAMIHPGFYNNNASGISDTERLARLVRGCQAVCVRSCTEFEGDYIDLYRNMIHKDVMPVGILPPPPKVEESGGEWSETFKWLDQQDRRSVVYVGFGSEYKLTKDEVYEIAYGLEISQLPFVWALRRPTWAVDDSEALPTGFLARMSGSGKGVVCLGWAPQLQILAHPSVGGSFIHCGWSSIIETLQHGHNLTLLPCFVDQGLIARSLVDKGLGIEVERREDGSFTRDDVANALKKAMLGDEAKEIMLRAKEAATIFADRNLHDQHYISLFVNLLRNGTLHD